MSAPVFGYQFSRPDDEIVPALGADFSKFLLVETSEDASAAEIPLETAVRSSSSDPDFRAALGTGLLADQVKAITGELTSINRGADVTVVRVAEGVDTAATAAAIASVIDGMADIPAAVNATPRIVIAGRTAWRPDMETTNPVIVSLQSNLPKILAVAPVDVDDTSSANAIDAREGMESTRILPIGIAAKVWDGATLVTRPAAAHVGGLFARVDNEFGGRPFNPIANRALNIAGVSRNIAFSLADGSTEGQQMLAANVAIIDQGETAVDGAIADGGFYFVGTDSATTSTLWSQIHQVRGADYIQVKIMEITRHFLGGKISADLAEAWLRSIKEMLRFHQANGDILGFDLAFPADTNTPEQISLGRLQVTPHIEPGPVFKRADHEMRRYRPALDMLVGDIIDRLDDAA
ncbi:MAG: phage tail protein [Pseudomonadota bacterium]